MDKQRPCRGIAEVAQDKRATLRFAQDEQGKSRIDATETGRVRNLGLGTRLNRLGRESCNQSSTAGNTA